MLDRSAPMVAQADYMSHVADQEAEAAAALIRILLDRGYAVTVNDGRKEVLHRSIEHDAILGAMGSNGEDSIVCHDEHGDRVAWFLLLYGRGPTFLIADHTDNRYAASVRNAWEDEVATAVAGARAPDQAGAAGA